MERPRYLSLRTYLKSRFSSPVFKISLDAGLSCPNRDGRLSTRGCIYCNEKGSGSGAAGDGLSIREQMERALARRTDDGRRYIAYFQSFTNTYGPLDRLKKNWDEALAYPEVIGLSIGTRPDCLSDEVVSVLAQYTETREVWLELGLQSASDDTLWRINRGHTSAVFKDAALRARDAGLKVVAHVILGLPGEGLDDILNTAAFIAAMNLDGVKLHNIYVAKGTVLAEMYGNGGFRCQTREEYADFVVSFLENIPRSMVVHRLTGDPAPGELVAPEWTLDKSKTIQLIRDLLECRDTWQGRSLESESTG